MAIVDGTTYNPWTGELDKTLSNDQVTAIGDPRYLLIDQTTPQTITATDTTITASDEIYFGDATDTFKIKKDTVQGILDLVPATDLSGYLLNTTDTFTGTLNIVGDIGIVSTSATAQDVDVTNSTSNASLISYDCNIDKSGVYDDFFGANTSFGMLFDYTDTGVMSGDSADIKTTGQKFKVTVNGGVTSDNTFSPGLRVVTGYDALVFHTGPWTGIAGDSKTIGLDISTTGNMLINNGSGTFTAENFGAKFTLNSGDFLTAGTLTKTGYGVYIDASQTNYAGTIYGCYLKGASNLGTEWGIYNDNNYGDNFLGKDEIKQYLGTGKDSSMYYDSTNLIINPKEVGSGILDIQGRLQTDGYNAVDGTVALAGTKVYYVSDSSGGAVTRKLTFKDGLLVSET